MTPVLSAAQTALQKRLQHDFSDTRLLLRALTHRSFSTDHYERLEFLGDSVLNLAISDLLYQKLGGLSEGELSRVRANLVRQETLHELALGLQLPETLRLGEGEFRSGGQQRPSILADVLEALIGAVYCDAGFDKAVALVHRLFARFELAPEMRAAEKDPKTELQEWLQGRKMKLPAYRVVAVLGAAHRQTFDVECEVTEIERSERGIGGSRRAGEQAAAAAMLAYLKSRNP
ncbi:ribonuclease III [Xylophilus rhododendri]|uniref:Ribonuclease 3 n=1 Tax=Xylophilus rhododendri TaxID=2697032 RepID=A0A857J470_9BURK|nr:ribonuclease III [Xylophilus rhododendri]QHI98033.1 ribonuclease III [Xylophilus rhododendri]